MRYTRYAHTVIVGCFFVLVSCFFYWNFQAAHAQKNTAQVVQSAQQTQVAQAQKPGIFQNILNKVTGGQKTTQQAAQATQGQDVQQHFNKILTIAKTIITFIKNVIFSITQKIMQLNYFDAATGKAVAQVQVAETVLKPVGVIFEFSPEQAGKGFDGMFVRPILGLLPEAISLVKNIFKLDLMPLVDSVLLYPLVPLVEGTISKDQQTGRLILKTGPFLEFIFKSALLLSNESQGRLQSGVYDTQINLLIVRLKKTPGFTTIDEIFKKIPVPFRALLEIKVFGKSVKDVLAELMAHAQEDDALIGSDAPQVPDVPVLVPEPEDMSQDSMLKELETLTGSKEMQDLGLTPEEVAQFKQEVQAVSTTGSDASDASIDLSQPVLPEKTVTVSAPVRPEQAQVTPTQPAPAKLEITQEAPVGTQTQDESVVLEDLTRLLESGQGAGQ